jgi:hypothetical protein
MGMPHWIRAFWMDFEGLRIVNSATVQAMP